MSHSNSSDSHGKRRMGYGYEQRKADLEGNIKRELKLLREFEEEKQLESNRRALLRIDAEIKRQKDAISEYQQQWFTLTGEEYFIESAHHDTKADVAIPALAINYQDFEIEARPLGGREYELVIIRSPGGEARDQATFPFDEGELQEELQHLANTLLLSRSLEKTDLREELQRVEDFGRKLFAFLLPNDLLRVYGASLSKVEEAGDGLRLKLRFNDNDATLAFLPWEFMYDGTIPEYVCLSKKTSLVRYLEVQRATPPLRVAAPLRILGMVVDAKNFPRLQVEQEKQRLETAVQGLKTRGAVELHWLEGQTWRDLQTALRREPWHIFHFIGHGTFDKARDEGQLVFADQQGKGELFGAVKLARLLADHEPMRLVLLNACDGAAGGAELFSGTAPVLVRRGVPAVLAMQYAIGDTNAVELARSFYEALADGYPVDASVAEARKGMSFVGDHNMEWGVPVLYMRAQDGAIFEVDG